MPRIFMAGSVLAGQRGRAFAPHRLAPAGALAAGSALREEREDRQNEEVLGEEDDGSDRARQRRGEAQVALPEARCTRPPELEAVAFGRDALELRAGVAHVEDLVVEDAPEHLAGLLVRDDFAVDGEAAGGGLLGQVEERQERRVALLVHAQVVEAALARSEPVRLERGGPVRTESRQDVVPADPEEVGVALLVGGVAQEEPSQQGIPGELRRARQVASALRLGGSDGEEL